MSSTTCVGLVTNTSIPPPAPAGPIAAFPTTEPSNEFRVETYGFAEPVGQVVRYASAPSGTTVTFSEYASAVAGIPQALAGIGNVREVDAPISGPPNGLFAFRVSAIRHGVTGWKVSAPGKPGCPK